jgi:hypothetical protein
LGLAVQRGEWIYCSNRDDGGRAFKLKLDGSGGTRINNDNSDFIIVVDDWIYYKNQTDKGRLCKMKTDAGWIMSDISVADGYIYYGGGLDTGDGIFWMKTDGSNNTKISEDEVFNSIAVAGDFIYYNLYDEEKNYYRISKYGSKREKLSSDWASNINIAGDWIIYKNNDDFLQYMLRKDGSEKLLMAQPTGSSSSIWGNTTGNIINSGFATLSGDWVYYSNGNDEDRLFKMKKNGISVTRLYGLSARLLNVSGDWIYFKNRDSLISRIKNDGSTREFDLEIAAG